MTVLTRALVFSCIAFSIVFIVLGGLTLVIYAMRLLTGDSSGSSDSAPVAVKEPATTKAEAKQETGINSRHVAAITAAILAATQGRGRILGITPTPRAISSETTRMWRTAGIVESIGRRLAPSWKR